MGKEFNLVVKNLMLGEIKKWSPGGSNDIYIGVFSADADGAFISKTKANYLNPIYGELGLAEPVEVRIPAGTTITHIRIFKQAGDSMYLIYKEDIPSETFTEDDYLLFEEATISLTDDF